VFDLQRNISQAVLRWIFAAHDGRWRPISDIFANIHVLVDLQLIGPKE
jgi:hypothetical protein